jgi:hypothetical protein
VREITLVPGSAVNVAAPQPVNVGAGELTIVRPVGSGSVTEKFVRPVLAGAKISILNLELPPEGIEGFVNVFAPVTFVPLTTVTVDVAEVRLPIPWAVVSTPGPILFVNCPKVAFAGALTTTETVHVPGWVGVPMGISPPVKLRVVGVPAGVVVMLPPQVLLAMLSIVRGAGIVSVNATPV